MYARATELAEVLDLLRLGHDVVVEGPRGSGRTEFLRRVAVDLEATDVQVLTSASLRTASLRPTRKSTGASTTALDAAALVQDLRHAGGSALVIDDGDELSGAVSTLVDLVHEGLRAPLLLAARPMPRADRRDLPRAARDAIVISLGPLAFPDVVEALRDELGLRGDPELVARIVTKSAGNPGLVKAIAVTARETGVITERDGTWSMTGTTIWNDRLRGAAGRLTMMVSDSEYAALYALALAGHSSIDAVLETIDETTLTTLSARGLVTVIGDGGPESLLAVSPPLLVDYFRHLPPSPERLLAMRRFLHPDVEGRTGSATPPKPPHVEQIALSRSVPAPDPSDATLVRYFADHAASRTSASWRRWSAERSADNAVELLRDAVENGTRNPALRDVIRDTEWSTADHDRSLIDFLGLAAIVVAAGGLPRADLLERRAEVENARPALVAALIGQQAIIDSLAGYPVEARRLPPGDGAEDPLVATWRALALVLEGDGGRALDVLPSSSEDGAWLLEIIVPLVRGLALFSTGSTAEMLGAALDGIIASKRSLHRQGVFLHSYLATLALVRSGRWEDARVVLGPLFALGSPPWSVRHEYIGMCRLAAMLAVREGDPVFAQTLLAAADDVDRGDGAVPGAQAQIGVAIRALIEGNSDAAATAMAGAAGAAVRLGSRTAGLSAQLYAVCLRPDAATVDALQALVSETADTTHHQFARFASAAVTLPSDALTAARSYEPDADVFLAILVTRSLIEGAGPEPSGERESLEAAVAELTVRSGWRGPAEYFPTDTSDVSELTEREREIGLLAGTRSNAQIADSLNLSVRTVANHVSNALRKLGLSSRAELFERIRSDRAGRA